MGKTKKKTRKSSTHGNQPELKGDLTCPYRDLAAEGKGEGLLFPFDEKALAQLARGTAVVIATCLALPDAIAIIPTSTSAVSWGIRLIGIWTIAAVAWFVGFLFLTGVFRLISGGVVLTAKGLKVSRFDRLIPYETIHSLSLEPNYFFTRIFSLPETARRLTVLFDLGFGGSIVKKFLFPNFLPSFFFTTATFDSLVLHLVERCGMVQPAEPSLVSGFSLSRSGELSRIAATFRFMAKQRVLVTVIIAISLVSFLGRKAVVNFAYNQGNKIYSQGRYDSAREYFEWAVKTDPTFAAGWNLLGQTHYRLAERNLTDFKKARSCWRTAILCKLDFVEPRINLARIALIDRDFDEALRLLVHAGKLAPSDALSRLMEAELLLKMGRLDDCAAQLAQVRKMAESKAGLTRSQRMLADCLSAQCKFYSGDKKAASAAIGGYSLEPANYHNDENVTLLLSSRALIDCRPDLAEAAVQRQPNNPDVLLQAAFVYLQQPALKSVQLKEDARCRSLLNLAAERSGGVNPWVGTLYCQLAFLGHDRPGALAFAKEALLVPEQNQDAVALSYLSEILQKNNCLELSKEAEGRAFALRARKLNRQFSILPS